MDSDSWIRLSTASRRYQSRSDLYNGGEEFDADDDSRPEFLCPFCSEEFDIVGLCCHIEEEHPVETKNGICPLCAKRVARDLVGHVTMQHGSLLRVQRRRRIRRGGSNSMLSILRRELREGDVQSFFGNPPYLVSSSSNEPDPLLSSFIFAPPADDEPMGVQCQSSIEACSVVESSKDTSSERNILQPPLSEKDQEEKARKCEFVQGLLLSTFLDDL